MCDEKNDNMIPLFPNDEGNCAYVDMHRLVKETFSDEFLFKMIYLSFVMQEKDEHKRTEMLEEFANACKIQKDKGEK